jgi:uncharacterized protein YjdB
VKYMLAKSRAVVALTAPLFVLWIAACGESTSSATVSAIAISPSPCVVSRTNSRQMSAVATLTNGNKRDVTSDSQTHWSSDNTDTATVNPTGVVVGVNPGITEITAEYQDATGSTHCTVLP